MSCQIFVLKTILIPKIPDNKLVRRQSAFNAYKYLTKQIICSIERLSRPIYEERRCKLTLACNVLTSCSAFCILNLQSPRSLLASPEQNKKGIKIRIRVVQKVIINYSFSILFMLKTLNVLSQASSVKQKLAKTYPKNYL